MTCASCVHRIESHVMSLRGVESCSVALATSSATVEFSPTVIGPRDIIERIQNLGYSAELASREDRLKRLGHAEDILKWRTSFLISLIFGVPVMMVMIYFHWIIHTPMHPEKQTHILVKALSLDNVILFTLATPVQVRPNFLHFLSCLFCILFCCDLRLITGSCRSFERKWNRNLVVPAGT